MLEEDLILAEVGIYFKINSVFNFSWFNLVISAY